MSPIMDSGSVESLSVRMRVIFLPGYSRTEREVPAWR
jgi:hypothetical protein